MFESWHNILWYKSLLFKQLFSLLYHITHFKFQVAQVTVCPSFWCMVCVKSKFSEIAFEADHKMGDWKKCGKSLCLYIVNLPDAPPPIGNIYPNEQNHPNFWKLFNIRHLKKILKWSILWPSPTLRAWRRRRYIFTKDHWLDQLMNRLPRCL